MALRAIGLVISTSVLLSCGPPPNNGGPLSGAAPFLASVRTSVRQLVVTDVEASRQAGTAAACTLAVDAFDTTSPIALTVLMTAGECTLYDPSSSLMVEQQSWVCIGALDVNYPGHNDANAVCPSAGHVPVGGYAFPLECSQLSASTGIQLASGDDGLPNDVVTDLDVTVTLPASRPSITQPTNLGSITWPASGDLPVAWTGGASATSALVTLGLQGAAPNIVCQPRTDGRTTVPAALIDAAGLRGQNVLLTVTSYRDTTTTAQMGMTWNASAGLGTIALLQARH